MSGGGARSAGSGKFFFFSRTRRPHLPHGQVGEVLLAPRDEFDRRVVLARARERARTALDLVDGYRGQLGDRNLELVRRPRMHRPREEAVEEVEVLLDDRAREPPPS